MLAPSAFIAEVVGRLRTMAARPPYRFKRTPRFEAERFAARYSTFTGFSESEIQAVENWVGSALPQTYRAFLARMGRSQGRLFAGTDLPAPDEFPAFRARAEALLLESRSSLVLPTGAIVFLIHQGYTFAFLTVPSASDGPVHTYLEGEASFTEASPSFQMFVEAELTAAEAAHEALLASGGYFITVHPGGAVSEEYPALSSGIRPLAFRDDIIR